MNTSRLYTLLLSLAILLLGCRDEHETPAEFSMPGEWHISDYSRRVEVVGQPTKTDHKTYPGKIKFNADGTGKVTIYQSGVYLTAGNMTWNYSNQFLTLDMTIDPEFNRSIGFWAEVVSPAKLKLSFSTMGGMTDTHTTMTLIKK
jgi:hypothetical protein